ncbi:Hypothetical predicted protein, partial [Olea europaea subsp. europaea]
FKAPWIHIAPRRRWAFTLPPLPTPHQARPKHLGGGLPSGHPKITESSLLP